MMRKLWIICGPQGSGKTAITQSLKSAMGEHYVMELHATDEIPEMVEDSLKMIIVEEVINKGQIHLWESAMAHETIKTEGDQVYVGLIALCVQRHTPTEEEMVLYKNTREYLVLD